GRQHLRAGAYGEAADRLRHGLSLSGGLAGSAELTRELRQELRRARRAQGAARLHALADRLRFLCGGPTPGRKIAALRPLWREVWDGRRALLDREGAELPGEVEERLRADLLDLGLIWADLSVRLAEPAARGAAAREALAVLGETEAL